MKPHIPFHPLLLATLVSLLAVQTHVSPPLAAQQGKEAAPAATEICAEPDVRTVGALQSRLEALGPGAGGAGVAGRAGVAGQMDAGQADAAGQAAAFAGGADVDLAERCELAHLYLHAGRLDEAEGLLSDILDEDPDLVPAMLLLARVHGVDQQDEEVRELLERAEAAAPGDRQVRLLRARHLMDRVDPADAILVYTSILVEDPESVPALVGSADAHLRRGEEDLARESLDRALALDSLHVDAHRLYSEVHRRALDEGARAESLHRALALDSLSVETQRAMATMLRQNQDVDGAYERFMAVLEFNPTHDGVHRDLGNGGSRVAWGRYPPFDDDEVPEDLAGRLDEADRLLREREVDAAEALLQEVLEDHPDLAAARLGLASALYYRGEFEQARSDFLAIATDHPGLGLAHYGVIESTKRMREARDPRIREAYERFLALPRPPEPERLRDVFLDFDRLDEDLQKIVLLSVAPLSEYIPILAVAGGTHRLLPFHHPLWRLPGTARSRGRRTFDGRLWDDVKGQGGRHAVSGEEWVRETAYERFNVLSHEFMHQIHGLFTPEQRDAVEEMFESAREERRTLDPYADSNPQEYLAQAYEAFISPIKDPRLSGTAGNTRSRIRELDPQIFALLEGVNGLETYLPHALLALEDQAEDAEDEEAIRAVEDEAAWVIRRYGENSEVVGLQADLAHRRGDLDTALERQLRVVEREPDAPGAWVRLARYHVEAWELDEAQAALERADETAPGMLEDPDYVEVRQELRNRRGG